MTASLSVDTPLGPGAFVLIGFTGTESISTLFSFQLDLLADREIPFAELLGAPITVTLTDGPQRRFFSGICSRLTQGDRGETYTVFRAEVVPQLWLLTQRRRSRFFQDRSVPEIVTDGLDAQSRLFGTYHPRSYVAQYRETDFDFASRLMEDEGIFYFFTHGSGGFNDMILDDTQGSEQVGAFPYAPGAGDRIAAVASWEKTQELRPGKVTLWDHHFQLPGGGHLEAEATVQPSVRAGRVTHTLESAFEAYDYPGGYAQRFDGVAPDGSDRSADLAKLPAEGARTAEIRMQEEAATALTVRGRSNCAAFTAGHLFTLQGHPDADGSYLITSVRHSASAGASYSNTFTCIPSGLRYRPPRVTRKPVVAGPQTAIVTGPAGEEIHTDRYGRVKVQFHWDREAKSSCWIRVAAVFAGGPRAGLASPRMVDYPRIGQEVVVDFLEGDPDRPVIVGSVYNADQLPPYQPRF